MLTGRSMRLLTLAALLLPACGHAPKHQADVLLIEPARYDAAFDAASSAARAAGLEPVFRERAGGVIETAAMPASSILEPWGTDNATLGQAVENTIAWQRRRARFEFTPSGGAGDSGAGAGAGAGGGGGGGGGPDLLAIGETPVNLATSPGPLELRVRVIVERAQAPGIQRDPWSRSLTTRSMVRRGDEPWPAFLIRTPVSRDVAIEQRLLSAVQEAIGP